MMIKRVINEFNDFIIKKRGEISSNDIISRQRLYTFTYGTAGLLVGIAINLLGISGPQALFYVYANSLHLIIILATLLLVYNKKITVLQALITMLLTTQIEISAEMLYSAGQNTPYGISLITGNMVLLSIILLVSVVAYMKYIPLVISTLSIGTYLVCSLMTGDEHLLNFFGIFMIAYVTLALLSYRLISQISRFRGKNAGLKEEHKVMLDLFRMDKKQLKAYITLAQKKDMTRQEVDALMVDLGYKARENIRCNVSFLMEQEQINYSSMERFFPMLSPFECEICRLVLEGKKLSEVCTLLGKTENNISFRRSGIRAKLRLEKDDDLRTKLLEMTKETAETPVIVQPANL